MELVLFAVGSTKQGTSKTVRLAQHICFNQTGSFMALEFINHSLKAYPSGLPTRQRWFWLSLSLTIAVACGAIALANAFGHEYVVQDDARHHVFWMRRYLDPDLFPNDLIADYFQSVAPLGYSSFYRFFAWFGVDPINLNKLLPIGLGVVTTLYCFETCIQLLPVPMAGFLGSLLLNQLVWAEDNLISATPRAFVYPLFLAFLYYRMRRSRVACLVTIALLGLFYPQYVFIAVGVLILQLVRWQGWHPVLSRDRQDYWFCLAGCGVAVLVLLPYLLSVSEFDPVVTLKQAREMREFSHDGRVPYFSEKPLKFWLWNLNSGVAPPSAVPLLWVGVALPRLLAMPQVFGLARQISSDVSLLLRVLVASGGMFFAAHVLFLHLHLPSRYTIHSLRMVLAIAAGLVLTLLLEALWRWATARPYWFKTAAATSAVALLIAVLLLNPLQDSEFGRKAYIEGEAPELYEFFAQQPKDILIASVVYEARSISTFSQRSVLISREHALPFHMGYYRQFRQRVLDLLRAQYTTKPERLQEFINTYGIDFWVIDRGAFKPNYVMNGWIKQYDPLVERLNERLANGAVPALEKVVKPCTVMDTANMLVLEARCILERSELKQKS